MWVGTCVSLELLHLLVMQLTFSVGHYLLLWKNRIGHICKLVYNGKFWGRRKDDLVCREALNKHVLPSFSPFSFLIN